MSQAGQADVKGSVRLGNYLRRLRTGYGYSLRRVEERARAEGGELDNSQLSRYEKGVCYPSFDKLRVLATVFNVPVQAFSDVVDLEAYEPLKPEGDDPGRILEVGRAALKAGEFGKAFAAFEKAIELLESAPNADGDEVHSAPMARISLGHVLARMGKLALAERELRSALRRGDGIGTEPTARALLALANLHADQGDLMLAEIEAERALSMATEADLPAVAAMSTHALARILAQRGRYGEAIGRYRDAGDIYARMDNSFEGIRVRVNIGDCYVAMGKVREGIRLLRSALQEAKAEGHRRLEAQAWSDLGDAYLRLGEHDSAQRCFKESDTLAGNGSERYFDLLFFNAFGEWKIARQQGNPTREKIAFGRLKVLRSHVERRLPEVDAFDAIVERGRNHE